MSYIKLALNTLLFCSFTLFCVAPFYAIEFQGVESNTAKLEKGNPVAAGVTSYRIATLQARKANTHTTDLFTRLDAANAALAIK